MGLLKKCHLESGLNQRDEDARELSATQVPEREFPALLVFWAYQQNQLFFGRGQFLFARKREKKIGCFFRLLGVCFVVLGGVFVVLGCFLFFAR